MKQSFLSDNASPAHPDVVEYVSRLPRDHMTSYGDDPITEEASQAMRTLFDADCQTGFVYNGTGANVSALRCLTLPYQAVICTEPAHINEDEGGAPEAIGGFKLLGVHTPDGRMRPQDIAPFLARLGFEHTNQPAVVSLTQATEVGTVYWPEDLRAISDAAHDAGLLVHMDGARIANAAAAVAARSPGMSPVAAMRSITRDVEIDVVSFGATKNGLMFGEAVVFLSEHGRRHFPYYRKQTTQLHSKMRYLSGQFIPYLSTDLWYRNAVAANEGAQRLSSGLAALPGCEVPIPTEANGVFATLPPALIGPLQEAFGFYTWDASRHMVRLMVSWDTRSEFIDSFLARTRELLAAAD